MVEVRIDFETRSKIDLKKSGAERYARDPSTSVLLMRFKFTDDAEVHYWLPWHSSKALERLYSHVRSGEVLTAHNAAFEQAIWQFVMQPEWGFPEISIPQWRCSAAMAAAHALPRDLGSCGRALSLAVTKDEEGKRAMMKLAKPRKPTKNKRRIWHSDQEDFQINFDYCGTDVLSEDAIHSYLPPLVDKEQKVWEMDQTINQRGVKVDLEAIEKAIEIMALFKESYNNEMNALTDGYVSATTKNKALTEWLCANGCETDSVNKETVENLLSSEDLTPTVRRVLELKKKGGKTSGAKYQAFLNSVCSDGRVRGLFLYAGANTLRWAGRLVQLHNLPRGILGNDDPEISEQNMRKAVQAIKDKDVATLQEFGDIQEVLSSCIRGMIIPDHGKKFYVADYAAIEARVLFWLFMDEEALDIFRNNKDIYKDMASEIYQVPYDKVTKDQRQMGKQAILGLGYQMGDFTFNATCESYKIDLLEVFCNKIWGDYENQLEKADNKLNAKQTLFACLYNNEVFSGIFMDKEGKKHTAPSTDIHELNTMDWYYRNCTTPIRDKADLIVWAKENATSNWDSKEGLNFKKIFSKKIVSAYRKKFDKVRKGWRAQEDAAVAAVQTPDTEIVCGRIKWIFQGRFLRCILPSGRSNVYVDPWLEEKMTSWGESKLSLHFMGMKDGRWGRDHTYGGKLVENEVQAIARDLLAEGMIECEKAGYHVVMHVHDEAVVEIPEDFGSIEEFESLIAHLPEWATGLPLKAEGEMMERYRK